MQVVYPALDSPEFEHAFQQVLDGIGELRKLFAVHGIGENAEPAAPASPGNAGQTVAAFEDVIGRLNPLFELVTTVNAYVYAFVSTEADNQLAQAKQSELTTSLAELSKLESRLTAWIGGLDIDRLTAASPVAAEHSFMLHKSAEEAKHRMSQPEEDLAASLYLSGADAWSRLHSNVTSLLSVEVTLPGEPAQRMPMSKVRALAHNPDPGVRKAGYEAELAGWESVEIPIAAALNGVKGFTNTLNERRSWISSIEPSLHMNSVDAQTLEAMQAAVKESFPDFRGYLTSKANMLNKQALPWWDLHAPIGNGGGWSYEQAKQFVEEQFAGFSPRMAALAKRAFQEQWIDAEPRTGKQQGGYCMTIRGDESRVMINFDPSFDAVQTLAHELGHAYHHMAIARRTPLQRKTPMALAETASTFCQAVVFNAALEEAPESQKLAMLESSLQDACGYSLDIHSRFLFEKAVFEGRQKRELSVDELKELMLEAQRQTYGDSLDPEAMHPYMWAAKVHYYMADLSYYNWPYTFGMLFAFGLYARWRQEPDGFQGRYDDLLTSTGLFDAAHLASRFGMDIRSVEFWRSSLDVCRGRIQQFKELAAAGTLSGKNA